MKHFKTKKVSFHIGVRIATLMATLFLAALPESPASAPPAPKPINGMVYIEGGTFTMGRDSGRSFEKPAHQVTVSGFYMDTTEVTQEDYERITGNNPSLFKGCPKCPVEQVSWREANDYCAKVNKRLPAEAEWEYACRAGSVTTYYWGDTINGAYAWYSDNAQRTTHPVGQKKPNRYGLYDMSGNVYEWCFDWFDENAYSKNSTHNKTTAQQGESRIFRGGSWNNNYDGLPYALRGWDMPDSRNTNVGFRCAR